MLSRSSCHCCAQCGRCALSPSLVKLHILANHLNIWMIDILDNRCLDDQRSTVIYFNSGRSHDSYLLVINKFLKNYVQKSDLIAMK